MALCSVCSEPITNPICPECIARSIEIWLMQNNPKLVEVIRSRLYLFKGMSDIDESISCIKCRSPMNVCAYCVSKEFYDTIHESNDTITLQTFPFKF